MLAIRKNTTMPANFLNSFFNDSFWPMHTSWNNELKHSNMPAVNVEETEREYLIEVAAPGLDKKDFKVSVDKDILTIASTLEGKREEKNADFIRREFSYSSFSRSFRLPEGANAEKIKAVHKNGVLTISLPKSEEKVKKAIEIKVN